jgi:hypothetical protein
MTDYLEPQNFKYSAQLIIHSLTNLKKKIVHKILLFKPKLIKVL